MIDLTTIDAANTPAVGPRPYAPNAMWSPIWAWWNSTVEPEMATGTGSVF